MRIKSAAGVAEPIHLANLILDGNEIADVAQEPRIDLGQVVDFLDRQAGLEGVTDEEDTLLIGD